MLWGREGLHTEEWLRTLSLILHFSCSSFELAWFKAGGCISQVVQPRSSAAISLLPKKKSTWNKAHCESDVMCAVPLHWHADTSKTVCALSLHGLYERNIWFDLTGSCMNRQVKHINSPGTPLCFALNSFKSPFIQVVWSKPSLFCVVWNHLPVCNSSLKHLSAWIDHCLFHLSFICLYIWTYWCVCTTKSSAEIGKLSINVFNKWPANTWGKPISSSHKDIFCLQHFINRI